MGKGDNSLLISVALLEKVKPQLKDDKRDQLTRVNLTAIGNSLSQAMAGVNKAGIDDAYLLGYLVSTVEFIDSLLSEPSYMETDTETKDIITKQVLECLDNLYLVAGKYYTDNDFTYSIKAEPILTRIVDKCIEKGYYFGEDGKASEHI